MHPPTPLPTHPLTHPRMPQCTPPRMPRLKDHLATRLTDLNEVFFGDDTRGAERDGDRAHNHRVQGADRVIVASIALRLRTRPTA